MKQTHETQTTWTYGIATISGRPATPSEMKAIWGGDIETIDAEIGAYQADITRREAREIDAAGYGEVHRGDITMAIETA